MTLQPQMLGKPQNQQKNHTPNSLFKTRLQSGVAVWNTSIVSRLIVPSSWLFSRVRAIQWLWPLTCLSRAAPDAPLIPEKIGPLPSSNLATSIMPLAPGLPPCIWSYPVKCGPIHWRCIQPTHLTTRLIHAAFFWHNYVLASYISSYSRSCWSEPFWKLLIKLYRWKKLPYFLDVNNIDLLVRCLGKKNILLKWWWLNGDESFGWNHQFDGSIGRLSPTQRKPTNPSNGENHQRGTSDTTLPYKGTTLPYQRLGSARIAAAWHPWNTWRPGWWFVFRSFVKRRGRWWWLPQVEHFQNGISLVPSLLLVSCWSVMLNLGRVNLCQF